MMTDFYPVNLGLLQWAPSRTHAYDIFTLLSPPPESLTAIKKLGLAVVMEDTARRECSPSGSSAHTTSVRLMSES